MNYYKKCFTSQRLSKYSKNTRSEKEIMDKYFYNIQLSKELYVLIALFEVSLRNHINYAINEYIHKNWLMDCSFLQQFLTENELKSYYLATSRLNERNKLTQDNLVTELNLGFWVNLFKKIYAPRLWHKKYVFESVFPYFDKKNNNRMDYIYPKLKAIQKIRNRISHHESIFDYKHDLDNFYYNILECLNFIEPNLKNDALEICQFEDSWNKFIFEVNNAI
jgi:hypothetical protein